MTIFIVFENKSTHTACPYLLQYNNYVPLIINSNNNSTMLQIHKILLLRLQLPLLLLLIFYCSPLAESSMLTMLTVISLDDELFKTSSSCTDPLLSVTLYDVSLKNTVSAAK